MPPISVPALEKAPSITELEGADQYLRRPYVRGFLNDMLLALLREQPGDPAAFLKGVLGGASAPSLSSSLTVSPMVLPSSSQPNPPLLALPPTNGGVDKGISQTRGPYTLPRPALPVSLTRHPDTLPVPSSVPLPPRDRPTSHARQSPGLVSRKRLEAFSHREVDWVNVVGGILMGGASATTPSSEVACQTEDSSIMTPTNSSAHMGSAAQTKEYHQDDKDGAYQEEEEAMKEDPPPPPPAVLARRFPAPQSHFTLTNPNKRSGGNKTGSLRGKKPPPLDVQAAEFSGEGNFGTVVKGYWRPEAAPEGPPLPLALKVVPVASKWSLDEVTALDKCTVAAKRVAASPVGGLRGRVEERGAASVVRPVGPCCYDPRTNSLWMPLPWIPLTLEGWVKHRQMRKTQQTSLFTSEEVGVVAHRLLCGVHFLSECVGVAHLDIKPANVLLHGSSYPDVDRHVQSSPGKLGVSMCDLGLSQAVGGPLQQLGDYNFMAPEIFWCDEPSGFTPRDADDRDADPTNAVDLSTRVGRLALTGAGETQRGAPMNTFFGAHDVWSVGCVLLYMLDGCVTSTWGPEDYFGAIRDNYLSPAPRHPSRWDPDLLHLVTVMLEKDPRRRPTPLDLLGKHPFFQRHSHIELL